MGNIAKGFLKAFDADTEGLNNGIWFPLGNGVEVLVASIHGEQAREYRRQLEQRYAKFQLRDQSFPDDISRKMAIEQMAHQTIKGWKGVPDPETLQEVPFSPEIAVKVFEKWPFFLDEIGQIALKKDKFIKELVEEGTGNSSNTSGGVSSPQ